MFAVRIESEFEPTAAGARTVFTGIAKSISDMVRLAGEADILGPVFRIYLVRCRAGGQKQRSQQTTDCKKYTLAIALNPNHLLRIPENPSRFPVATFMVNATLIFAWQHKMHLSLKIQAAIEKISCFSRKIAVGGLFG